MMKIESQRTGSNLQVSIRQKQVATAILIPDKIDFKTKLVRRDEEGGKGLN